MKNKEISSPKFAARWYALLWGDSGGTGGPSQLAFAHEGPALGICRVKLHDKPWGLLCCWPLPVSSSRYYVVQLLCMDILMICSWA